MLMLEDDTEDAPWMVMGDLQFDAASSFKYSLREYARAHGLPWYVASMVPIRYRWGLSKRRRQLSPDGFVAFVPDRRRNSFDMDAEGGFPPFVLEVISPASAVRDKGDKLQAYGVLGAREYVLFTPREGGASTLSGYRRDAAGLLVPWPAEVDGSLWSEVLSLRLRVDDESLVAETAAGERLLTPAQEAVARRVAEAENERLRLELARLKHESI